MDLSYYEEMKKNYISENKTLQSKIDSSLKVEIFDSNKVQSLKRLQKDNTQMIIDIDSNIKHLQEKRQEYYTSVDNSNFVSSGTISTSTITIDSCNTAFDKSDLKYKKLKQAIDNKESCIIDLRNVPECLHRGSGKTTCIAQLAYEYNIPVFCRKSNQRAYEDKMKEFGYEEWELKFVQFKRCMDLDGFTMVLIDEDISGVELNHFKDNHCILIGFYNCLT